MSYASRPEHCCFDRFIKHTKSGTSGNIHIDIQKRRKKKPKASFQKFYFHVVLVTQSCPTLCNPTDCGPPSSSIHGILQARLLDGLPFPSPGELSDSGIKTHMSCSTNKWILYHLSQGRFLSIAISFILNILFLFQRRSWASPYLSFQRSTPKPPALKMRNESRKATSS